MLNPYFTNFTNNSNEQSLLDSLIVESIQTYGINFLYLPRHNDNEDKLYNSSDIVHFSDYYEIEGYLENVTGFNDVTNIFSKFGLQINDQITVIISASRFNTLISGLANIPRPREGDLIYFPLNNKLFEIKFADNKKIFYPLGKLFEYHLTAELFEYSSERFNTGIDNIDRIQKYTNDILNQTIQTELEEFLLTDDGKYILFDSEFDIERNIIDDTVNIDTEAKTFISFTEDNPFAEEGNM